MNNRNSTKSTKDAGSQGLTQIRLLTSERVEEIHRGLVMALNLPADLGLRESSLLDLAVAHQYTCALGGDAREKAAGLVQGMFDERPFHDLNAETALVAMVLHLDLNGFEPNRVSFDEYYRLFAALAEHKLDQLATTSSRMLPQRKAGVVDGECELALLSQWLEGKTRRLERQDYALGMKTLRTLLESRDFGLQGGDGQVSLVRLEAQVEKRLFGLGSRTTTKATPLLQFPEPADGVVLQNQVRDIRKACGLESGEFYDLSSKVDALILQHLTLFPRLAKL